MICWQAIYKPGSGGALAHSGRSFLSGHGHPCPLAAYPRCLDRGGRLSPHIWPCSSRGLPCRTCYHARGGLLPHHFTLATRRWRSVFCGTFRRVQLSLFAPRRYLAACPLEPGLSSNKYHKDTYSRSPDHLRAPNIAGMTRHRPSACRKSFDHDDFLTSARSIPQPVLTHLRRNPCRSMPSVA